MQLNYKCHAYCDLFMTLQTTVVYYLKKVKGKVMDGTPDPIPMDMSKGNIQNDYCSILRLESRVETTRPTAGSTSNYSALLLCGTNFVILLVIILARLMNN